MDFVSTAIDGCYVVMPSPFEDARGWFARYYCEKAFAAIGHTRHWVQCNHSFTGLQGTVRGLHFQLPPAQEIKLVKCISGAVFDVAVDLRKKSPTYLKWFGFELSARNRAMLYIPEGVAHGFQTLLPDSELIYHHSNFFSPEHEAGIRYNDPILNIEWPLPIAQVSQRDGALPYTDSLINL